MITQKQISILGNNSAILPDLINSLLQQNIIINIFVSNINDILHVKDSLNRIRYFNLESQIAYSVINKSSAVINTLFIPTPSNILKMKKNIETAKKNIRYINKDIKFIDILPLVNEDKTKSFYKDIKHHEQKTSSHFSNYISLKTPVILAKRDSIIQDIETLYSLSKKVIRYKDNFSYVDKNELILAIILVLNNSNFENSSFNVGSYQSTNIDYINDTVILESRDVIKKSAVPLIYSAILSFIYKKQLKSFSKDYLYFLKSSKKSSLNDLNLSTFNKEYSLKYILNKYKNNGINI